MEQNKTGKYLKYAIGEIVLVVIGILIALSINNWNEAKSQDKKIEAILRQVQKDLVSTIERSNYLIEYYRNKDSLAYVLMNTSLTKDDLKNPLNYGLKNISVYFASFALQDDGFNNLMLKLETLPDKYDNIESGLKNIYITKKQTLDIISEGIKEVTDRTVYYQEENYAWYAESIFKRDQINDDWLEYILNDKHYKNSVAQVSLYANVLVKTVIEIRIDAIKYVREIDALLEEGNSYPFDVDVNDYTAWIGEYHSLGDTTGIDHGEGGMKRNWNKGEWKKIYPLSKTKFHYTDSYYFVFKKDEQGEIVGFTSSLNNYRRYWEKIK